MRRVAHFLAVVSCCPSGGVSHVVGLSSESERGIGGESLLGDSRGEIAGSFRLTSYWISYEHEVPAGPLVEQLCDLNERPIATVSAAFADQCRMQGTCRLSDRRMLNAAKRCNCAGGLCFDTINPRRFPWGRGSSQRPLVPFRSVATDRGVVPSGATVYLAELDGLKLPDGQVHDGCVIADDTGGEIRGMELDFFVARRKFWFGVRRELPAKVTAYVDSPRCL